jgi:hypothetical protein
LGGASALIDMLLLPWLFGNGHGYGQLPTRAESATVIDAAVVGATASAVAIDVLEVNPYLLRILTLFPMADDVSGGGHARRICLLSLVVEEEVIRRRSPQPPPHPRWPTQQWQLQPLLTLTNLHSQRTPQQQP